MNYILDTVEANPEARIKVFTTKNNTSYSTPIFPNTKIYRLGSISSNSFNRYTTYIWYNFVSSIILLLMKTDFIIAFESLSVFPLWITSNLKNRKNAHIHFHEFISQTERASSSKYMKLLFRIEDILLKKYPCSHTNEDRKLLFVKDKAWLNPDSVEVRPNMPPKSWWNEFGQYKQKSKDGKIRLVYVGACDNKTMYVKELLDLVANNPDKLQLTIISQQLDEETQKLILQYSKKPVKILPPIDYFNLPKELVNHDIGLVIYKGVNQNHIYSVPNKVFEYLACGLSVVCDISLTTTKKLKHKDIYLIDMKNLLAEFNLINAFY